MSKIDFEGSVEMVEISDHVLAAHDNPKTLILGHVVQHANRVGLRGKRIVDVAEKKDIMTARTEYQFACDIDLSEVIRSALELAYKITGDADYADALEIVWRDE